MKKILIIGSEGFIGHSCVTYFLKKGWEVYGCDLVDYSHGTYYYIKISRLQPSFEEIFSNVSYDVCINAAGNGSVPVSVEHPLNDFEANCGDVIRVLELIRLKNKNCKYLHISSAAVYGNPKTLPIEEHAAVSPLSPYGWHKLISEKLCEEYSALYDLFIAVVRPFSVYGPGLRKQLLWDMYQKTKVTAAIELWGEGTESRDFIYIDDLIYAIDLILEKSINTFDIYNLASGTETTIAHLADSFYKELDSGISYGFNHKSRPGDPKNWKADISKLSSLGFKPQFELKEGLKLTVAWLKKSD